MKWLNLMVVKRTEWEALHKIIETKDQVILEQAEYISNMQSAIEEVESLKEDALAREETIQSLFNVVRKRVPYDQAE